MPGERANAGAIGYDGTVGVAAESVKDLRCGDGLSVSRTATVPRGTRELQIARRYVDWQRVLWGLED